MYYQKIPLFMARGLICTILIEVIVGYIIDVRKKKDLFNILLVNVITNPIVVSFSAVSYLYYGEKVRLIVIIILELIAFLTEGFIYNKVIEKKINGYLLSLVLNVCSYFIGMIINRII